MYNKKVMHKEKIIILIIVIIYIMITQTWIGKNRKKTKNPSKPQGPRRYIE